MELSQLKHLRWAVRLVLALGVAASVAANVLHARNNPISQVIAAWPSVAFLLTVELTSRIPLSRPLLAGVRIAATAVIAGIAGWVSYWHMVGVAGRYGETSDSAHLLPFTVDGLIVVASVSLVELGSRIALFAVKVEQVVEAKAEPVPVPAPPAVALVAAPPATVVERVREARPVGRSGPQVTGPSKPGLNGKPLMEATPQV
jgi:hypothetical protein